MGGSTPGPAVAPAAPRRRRRPGKWLLVLCVALLVGRGLGWFGGVATPSEDPAAAPRSAEAATSTAGASGSAPRVGIPGSAAQRDGGAGPNAALDELEGTAGPGPTAAPAAPLAELAGRAPKEAHAALSSVPGEVEADRFASLLSLVQARTDEGRLGRAMSALHGLRALGLDEAQRAALVLPAQELENALAAACAEVVQRLCKGEVLAAHEAVLRLLADGAQFVQPVLAQSLALSGLRGDLLAVPVQDAAPWPVPAPLARDRALWARLGGVAVAGRVVASRADQVTLRVQGRHGVTFPTLRAVDTEPVDPTPGEAVEMGFCALHAGDALLARLWLGCAGLRQQGAAPARLQRLREVLE